MGLLSKYKCPICDKVVSYGLKAKDASGNMLYIMHPACAEILKSKSNHTIPPYPTDVNVIKGIMNGTIKRENQEYRRKCNVCGKVFCFSDADIGKNIDAVIRAQREAKNAMLNAIGGSQIGLYASKAMSQQHLNSIVDFKKCPYCNSSDLSDLTEEQYKAEVIKESKAQAEVKAPASAAEQIKQFKELLDSGIITQEEFDAKKKQLLGL